MSSNDQEPQPYQSPEETPLSGKEAYNVVSDTVTGVNLRVGDNALQAALIALSVVLGGGIGAVLALLNPTWNLPWFGGGLFGGFGGLVLGTFASGTAIMIYRGMRHAQGKHD
jgi:hypothetical protein